MTQELQALFETSWLIYVGLVAYPVGILIGVMI
jgi:hypothetical protein